MKLPRIDRISVIKEFGWLLNQNHLVPLDDGKAGNFKDTKGNLSPS